MSGAFEKAAANVTLPTATFSDTFPIAGVNTGGMDLGATGVELVGSYVWIKADEVCSIRAGATQATATAGDMILQADTDYSFRINKSTRWVSVFGGATGGTLFVAKAEGPPA